MSKEYLEALESLKQIEDVIETKIGLGVVNAYLIDIIKQALIKAQEQEKENINLKLLTAKKDGFFDGNGMWRTDEFIIDYDTIRKEFCLRSITNAYTLGRTRFYESNYKKTWWLREDKSE